MDYGPKTLLNFQGNEVDDLYLEWMLKSFTIAWGTNKGEAQKVIYNVHTLLTDLKFCSRRKDLQSGRRIHLKAVESRHGSNMYVVTALIRMYGKCGSMADARRVFDSIQKPDVVCWTALLLGYAGNGDGLSTLELFSKMKACGCAPDSVTYVAALKACTSLAGKHGQGEWLKRGREIHSEIDCGLNIFVQNTLIDMYGKCGSMTDARRVFDSIKKPDVVSWTALLLGYTENGEFIATLDLFSKMKTCQCAPDSVTYVAAIKACTSLAGAQDRRQGEWLERGREIHSEIDCKLDIFIQNTLIEMYGKCGSMVEAHRVFDGIQKPDVVCWNVLLLGYAENGNALATLELFSRMKSSGCIPSSVTFIAALKACTYLARNLDDSRQSEWLKQGREIHSEIGYNLNIFLQNTLIDMYGNFGSMLDARCIFDSIKKPDVVSWTALLMGYAENGDGFTTLELFSKMKGSGCSPNSVTYIAALKACGLVGALSLGRKFHLEIREFTGNVVTCLVDFYSRCGSMTEAHEVFNTHSKARKVSTWTALLTGYGSLGDIASVFDLFEAMKEQGFQPDAVTFVCILSCCSHAGLIEKAREYLEAMPKQYGINPTVMHYACMVDVLGRANQLNEAIALLQKMPCNPNAVTWMTLLGACSKWKNVEIGRHVFQSLMEMDNQNAIAYVLMAHIYGSRGMWEEQKRVLNASINAGACKHHGLAYVYDEVGNIVKFMVGKEDPPHVKNNLKKLLENVKELGYVTESYSTDADNEELCGHSERRAVGYGIMRTPLGEPVRVFKDMRMCDDCHGATKMMSKFSKRIIMVRDLSRFHVMVDGSCSCGDYW